MNALTYIKSTSQFGRGVYANYNVASNTHITDCELLILSAEDTIVVNRTGLKHYTFVFNETQDCIVLGDGEILNHSDKANVEYRIEYRDARSFMCFYSTRDILAGEQLFIDYNADTKIDIDSYIGSGSLI